MDWPEWAAFYNAVHQRPCELIGIDGVRSTLSVSDNSVEEAAVFLPFGEMIVCKRCFPSERTMLSLDFLKGEKMHSWCRVL